MKLLNHTLLYLSASLLLIIGVWAVVFYFSMMDEVYDSIDDGLDNYKILIIQKARNDSSTLIKSQFDESNYSITEIPKQTAWAMSERYADTLMYMENEKDFEPVRMLTTVFSMENGQFYQLKIISSMVEEDDLIEDLFYALIWLYAAIIVTIIFTNTFLLKKVWKPFYLLLSQLKNFNLSSTPLFEPPKTKVEEFKNLNETIVTLLNKNIEVFNSQKQFIENASHELQTPLAISINKIELMLESNSLTEEQAETIADVINHLERLTRLNKSLLLLSKIENKQFKEDELVNFNELIKQQLKDFSEIVEFKNIKITCNEHGIFKHYGNNDLSMILMTNLLKNAIIHNVNGGEIDIDITSDTLSISNTGRAEALNHEKIFSRFYKSTEKKNSTGLGLAIVKTISDWYKLNIRYSFNGKHTMTLQK